jgi:3-oxoacyl-[acyl-carrier protein] reductase
MAGALADRTIVVTGGSMGIGFACAEAALTEGARVLICARGDDGLADALGKLSNRAPGRVAAIACDVSVEQDVARLFDHVRSRFGAVHGVVHAAAVLGPIGPLAESAAAEWLETVRIDLFGTYLVARAAARTMKVHGYGKIVLLSGGGATAPFPNYSAYACSKAAVVRLAETLAFELEPFGIDVNALAPGFVATRIHEATLAAGDRAGEAYLQRTQLQLTAGGVPASMPARAAVFLLSAISDGIRGRLLAATWDEWTKWPEHATDIARSDVFTLRRVVPGDRGLSW